MANPRVPVGDAAPPRTAITPAEAAAKLAVSYEQALALCSVNGGPIRSWRVGRLIRIPVGAVEDYVAAVSTA